jgi:cob(I)alamin adenosyltransferase
MIKQTREYIDSLWKRRAEILDLLDNYKVRTGTEEYAELEAELDEIQEQLFLLTAFLHTPAKAPKDA